MSAETVSRRLLTISNDLELQLIEKLRNLPYYALQIDETTDVSSNGVLIIYVRYIDFELEDMKEEILRTLKL